jgi:hypothetical protein
MCLNPLKIQQSLIYFAKATRQQLVAGLIHDVLGRFGADTPSSLAAFVEAAEGFDEQALSLLESQLKNRRKRNRSR